MKMKSYCNLAIVFKKSNLKFSNKLSKQLISLFISNLLIATPLVGAFAQNGVGGANAQKDRMGLVSTHGGYSVHGSYSIDVPSSTQPDGRVLRVERDYSPKTSNYNATYIPTLRNPKYGGPDLFALPEVPAPGSSLARWHEYVSNANVGKLLFGTIVYDEQGQGVSLLKALVGNRDFKLSTLELPSIDNVDPTVLSKHLEALQNVLGAMDNLEFFSNLFVNYEQVRFLGSELLSIGAQAWEVMPKMNSVLDFMEAVYAGGVGSGDLNNGAVMHRVSDAITNYFAKESKGIASRIKAEKTQEVITAFSDSNLNQVIKQGKKANNYDVSMIEASRMITPRLEFLNELNVSSGLMNACNRAIRGEEISSFESSMIDVAYWVTQRASTVDTFLRTFVIESIGGRRMLVELDGLDPMVINGKKVDSIFDFFAMLSIVSLPLKGMGMISTSVMYILDSIGCLGMVTTGGLAVMDKFEEMSKGEQTFVAGMMLVGLVVTVVCAGRVGPAMEMERLAAQRMGREAEHLLPELVGRTDNVVARSGTLVETKPKGFLGELGEAIGNRYDTAKAKIGQIVDEIKAGMRPQEPAYANAPAGRGLRSNVPEPTNLNRPVEMAIGDEGVAGGPRRGKGPAPTVEPAKPSEPTTTDVTSGQGRWDKLRIAVKSLGNKVASKFPGLKIPSFTRSVLTDIFENPNLGFDHFMQTGPKEISVGKIVDTQVVDITRLERELTDVLNRTLGDRAKTIEFGYKDTLHPNKRVIGYKITLSEELDTGIAGKFLSGKGINYQILKPLRFFDNLDSFFNSLENELLHPSGSNHIVDLSYIDGSGYTLVFAIDHSNNLILANFGNVSREAAASLLQRIDTLMETNSIIYRAMPSLRRGVITIQYML
jgi:hypothetical protein